MSPLAHPHGPVPPEIVTIPAPPKEKFAEIQQSFQNDAGPLPLHPLDPEGPNEVDKSEIGPVLGTHAQSDGLVPSEFSDAVSLPTTKFAENLTETQMAMGPILLPSLTPKRPKAPDKSEFGSLLSSHAQFEGPVQSEFSGRTV